MWRMLQADKPDDFVLATGAGATVQRFADVAFAAAGLDSADHIEIDPKYYRPSEVDYLLGDPSKARDTLGWVARTRWDDLARIMVNADIGLLDDQLSGRVARLDGSAGRIAVGAPA